MSGDDEHLYRVNLEQGHIALLTIMQNGMDLLVATSGVNQVSEEFDTDDGRHGLEVTMLTAKLIWFIQNFDKSA